MLCLVRKSLILLFKKRLFKTLHNVQYCSLKGHSDRASNSSCRQTTKDSPTWSLLGSSKLSGKLGATCDWRYQLRALYISQWHGFLCQNEMNWWMDCGIFSDFVLQILIRIWENSSKISGSDTFSSACEDQLSYSRYRQYREGVERER